MLSAVEKSLPENGIHRTPRERYNPVAMGLYRVCALILLAWLAAALILYYSKSKWDGVDTGDGVLSHCQADHIIPRIRAALRALSSPAIAPVRYLRTEANPSAGC